MSAKVLHAIIAYFTFLSIFYWLSDAFADREDLSKQLKKIRYKILQTENELIPLKDEEKAVSEQIKNIKLQIKVLLEEQQKNKKRLETILKSQESLQSQMIEVREQISSKKANFEKRVVHMFKTRRKLMPLTFLFSSNGEISDVYKRSAYLRYLVKNDSNRLKEFTSLLETLRASKEEFYKLSKEYDQKIEESEGMRQEFDTKQLDLAKTEKSLELKISKLSKKLETYNEQEEEYEELLRELSENSTVVPNLETSVQGLKPHSLPFPVQGDIIQHYGKQKHGEFKDMIFVKGVEVTSGDGSAVRAVMPGEVVFSSELPGYGSVLILDHGAGIFSLYGRIVIGKSLGDKVASNEVIAQTGAKDSSGRNFYFELRKNGKALNPEPYFMN